MIVSNLYDKVLIEPFNKGANELFIVSGYASATFTHRHIKDFLKSDHAKRINLIIGMPTKASDHQAFINILDTNPGRFSGFYYEGRPNVHSKLYSWYQDDKPLLGFSGSANYSQSGFSEKLQRNQMVDDDPVAIREYYTSLLPSSTSMDKFKPDVIARYRPQKIEGALYPGSIEWLVENKSVRISFLDSYGNVSEKSGPNWGQRIDNMGRQRDLDQAYLSIRKDARDEGFLPDKGFTFTLLTDDGQALDCTVQQEGRKAISTTDSNSILGRYIRKRLGLASGAFITAVDFERYGRTDFTLEKIDDETFYFDMSIL